MKLKVVLVIFLLLVLVVPQAHAAKPTPPQPVPHSVCIDAGHGGSDTGAVNGSLIEKDINLEVANRLKTTLEANNYIVFMTRTDDSTLSNADRYNYCNSQKASLLISIHHNGSTDPNVDYSTALYMKKSDQKFAQLVVKSIATQLNLPNNGVSRFASGILLKADMPAAISEGFFLTNTNEYNLLTGNSNRLDQETSALFSSIQTFFNN